MKTARKYLDSQDGMALLIAVSMLLILSVLGVVMHEAASREVTSAAGFKAEEETFYAAERGVEYAMNRDLLISMGAGVNLMDDPHKSNINAGYTKSKGGEIGTGEVSDSGPGELPIKLKEKYGSDFGANYYYISVEAEGPMGAREEIETQVVRLFKRDDDSLFRTTGGG